MLNTSTAANALAAACLIDSSLPATPNNLPPGPGAGRCKMTRRTGLSVQRGTGQEAARIATERGGLAGAGVTRREHHR